jgi:ribosomal protein S18 acetylase RimI-like enzyme
MAVRPVHPDEIQVAWDTLARSFDDDPMFRWLAPDARERYAWLTVFMSFGLHTSMAAGTALCVDPGEQAGVIALMPPGSPPMTIGGIFGWLVRRLPRPDLPVPGRHFARGGLACLTAMDKRHPTYPHWYIFILGVHPDRKGQGLGRILMADVCARADRDQVPAYLETTNPVNLGFYQRFGFEVIDEVNPLPGAPPIWFMQRPA